MKENEEKGKFGRKRKKEERSKESGKNNGKKGVWGSVPEPEADQNPNRIIFSTARTRTGTVILPQIPVPCRKKVSNMVLID